jgi:hypothetical protein
MVMFGILAIVAVVLAKAVELGKKIEVEGKK